MKKIFLWSLLCITCLVAFKPAFPAFLEEVDAAQSKVTFRVGHLGGKVSGTFSGLQGSVFFDENNLAGSSMDVSLDASSVDTENRARDKDLRKEKFFHVEKYPRVSFRSKEITRIATGFQVVGDLTIKDQTHEETIPFTVEKTENGSLFKGSFKVDRKKYDLGKGSFPPIGKEVEVEITALVK